MAEEEHNPIQNFENPCNGCTRCCSYVAMELDEPEDNDDFDNIRWYLLHKNVWVFVDHDDSWNIQFNSPCEKIDEKGWCGYYEKRPSICRGYKSDNCEEHGDGDSYKLLFKNIEEYDEWFMNGQIIPQE